MESSSLAPTPPRPDAERLRALNSEIRPLDRLGAHYAIERELARRLRHSTPAERAALYTACYTELFDRVPDHPQHRLDPAKRRRNTDLQVAMLRRYVQPGSTFVEIGCGDAAVSAAVAAFAAETVGIDVTPALIDAPAMPANFRFVQTDGVHLPLPDATAHTAYSNQLMEHLHPDDAAQQLAEVRRILKPGGLYLCSTPNRVTGPHDISGYFRHDPDGFHLREYDHGSLARMFRAAGFRAVRARLSLKGRAAHLPIAPVAAAEAALMRLPRAARTALTGHHLARNLAGLMLVGTA